MDRTELGVAVDTMLRAVVEDQIAFNRRVKILEGLLADCAEIRAALAEDAEQQPA